MAALRQRAIGGTFLSAGVFRRGSCLADRDHLSSRIDGAGLSGHRTVMLPHCPSLPPPRAGLDWRLLNAFGAGDRGDRFYFACLEYAHALWLKRLPARAILCLDRAMGANLHGHEAVLKAWPIPYEAMAWMMCHTPRDVFIGNPRVHFQHYAGRMNEPRREIRRWRAWACWALARRAMPALRGDERHLVEEPTLRHIEVRLLRHGLRGEAARWSHALHHVRH
jgi:hypothetical protein